MPDVHFRLAEAERRLVKLEDRFDVLSIQVGRLIQGSEDMSRRIDNLSIEVSSMRRAMYTALFSLTTGAVLLAVSVLLAGRI